MCKFFHLFGCLGGCRIKHFDKHHDAFKSKLFSDLIAFTLQTNKSFSFKVIQYKHKFERKFSSEVLSILRRKKNASRYFC